MKTTSFKPVGMQGCDDVQRETFAALMDLYENNYIRLKKLIPALSDFEGTSVSTIAGCLDLHFTVLEKSRFTSLVVLSYLFDRHDEKVYEPNLKIRVYHDVAMAEALSGELHHGKLKLKNLPETAISERWQLNRFLYKWLGFCLHIGHKMGNEEGSDALNLRINQILSEKISS